MCVSVRLRVWEWVCGCMVVGVGVVCERVGACVWCVGVWVWVRLFIGENFDF